MTVSRATLVRSIVCRRIGVCAEPSICSCRGLAKIDRDAYSLLAAMASGTCTPAWSLMLMTRMDLAAYVTGDLVDRGPGRWVTGIARLGVDGLATAGAMMLASYSAWATVDFWTVPLIWPDVAVLWFLLIAGKYWLVRGGNRTPVEQLRVAVFWVVAVYGSAMAYVLLTRTYYSRSFLLTSLIALLLWQ